MYIFFSGEMVRQGVVGNKTCTRRIIPDGLTDEQAIAYLEKHYGKVGDVLWVRENWAVHPRYNKTSPSNLPFTSPMGNVTYMADVEHSGTGLTHGRVRPSIHMPRWASRYEIRIISLRPEPLHGIKPYEVVHEGACSENFYLKNPGWLVIDMFKSLWNSLNADRGYGWDKNPSVGVIGFEWVREHEV